MCKIPGCFLHGVEKAKEYSGRKFKKNKDTLVQEMYSLFNRSVFDKKVQLVNRHLTSTCPMPSALGFCKVCRSASCIFPALERCPFRSGGDACTRERSRQCLWVIIYGTDLSPAQDIGRGRKITECLSSPEIRLAGGRAGGGRLKDVGRATVMG